eukprot:6146264-Prymnesium_polylepis.2
MGCRHIREEAHGARAILHRTAGYFECSFYFARPPSEGASRHPFVCAVRAPSRPSDSPRRCTSWPHGSQPHGEGHAEVRAPRPGPWSLGGHRSAAAGIRDANVSSWRSPTVRGPRARGGHGLQAVWCRGARRRRTWRAAACGRGARRRVDVVVRVRRGVSCGRGLHTCSIVSAFMFTLSRTATTSTVFSTRISWTSRPVNGLKSTSDSCGYCEMPERSAPRSTMPILISSSNLAPSALAWPAYLSATSLSRAQDMNEYSMPPITPNWLGVQNAGGSMPPLIPR